jgi:hypothetical protein
MGSGFALFELALTNYAFGVNLDGWLVSGAATLRLMGLPNAALSSRQSRPRVLALPLNRNSSAE